MAFAHHPKLGYETMRRGRYFTISQAIEAYPGVLTERLIRRLVQERRIASTRAGRRVILAEADIEDYLDANRREPTGHAGPQSTSTRGPAGSRPAGRRGQPRRFKQPEGRNRG